MNTTPRKYYEGCADLGGTSNEEYKLDNGLGTTTVYSTTPSDKKLTPMAKVLKWVDEKYPNFNKADIEEYITSLLPEEREMVEMAWDDAYATGCVVGANDYTNEQDEDTGFNYFTNNYQQLPAMTHAVKPKCPKCGSDKINDGTGTGWEVCECGYMA